MSILQQNHKIRKWTVGTVLVFFILTQVFGGVFFYVKPAMAQLVVTDPVTGAQTTIKNIKDFLKILVINAGTMALINAASRFAQKIAYDLAVGIASGGKGQMPLFSTDGWGDYMKNAGLDAAGEFIGSFGDMVGVNFCAPPNPRVGLNLQLSLGSIYSGELPAPTCKWSEISSNWDSFVSEVQSEDFLREMASQFRVSYEAGTDLDLAMTGFIGAFDASTKAEKSALEERREGQGFKAVEEFISGKVKTPAEVVREASLGIVKDPKMAEEQKQAMMSQALAQGGTQILTMFASTFVSTLLSKTMDLIFKKGMVSLADLFPKSDSTTSEGTAWGGRRAAELAFADLLVPQIKEGGTYDVLTDFIVCPDKFKGVNNCVMDGNFEAAVRRAQTGEPLTVGEAIDEGLLHGEWPLFPPSNAAKNQDPYCYTYGYCYSNLVKLRKARIIPIGWEIAAQSQTSTEPVSLKEVVDKFRDCNYTDPAYPEGKADAEHKYCHLIDPDWILKAPLGQCRARVYGPLLQTAENSFRQEVCVDTPTCIAEDNQGNCAGGWGYCTREKNIWRLDGDQCDAQYDTCRALTRRDGQNVAYTINTIDYGPPCNADDIGCRWYSKRESKVGDIWQWQDVLTSTTAGPMRNDRIFFNKNIAQCDEPGCNEFLRTTADTRLNLVANSSFENFTGTVGDGTKDEFVSWPIPWGRYGDPNAEAVSGTYLGQTAIKARGVIGQTVQLDKERGGRTFTLSLFAKGCSATSTFDFGGEITARNIPAPSDTAWQRYQVTRSFPAGDETTIDIAFYNASISPTAPCLIDAVQLEEGSSASNYHEGWGRTGEAVYLKTAPDYYSCYDYTGSGALNKTNDADQCKNYAAACEEKDVGCEQYTPTNGDPFVPGVANYPDDYCPAECVGYQTFKQVATDFEQDKFPVYFIPSTGRTCSAADVGCDQFTSLETEAVANFNYVRRCEKPGATSAAFYTWEGSDTTGYQLKTWSLKVGANYDPADPRILYSPDGGTGPCTKLNVTDPSLCADDGITGTCTKADTLANPDCREFYDAAGKKHYRLYSKTIVATDDCHPYRKTVSSASDCGTSGGKWDDTKNECVYQIYLPESRSCSNEAVGCRAYRGNAGANTAVIFTTNFDGGDLGGWSAAATPEISSESLTVGGKSLPMSVGRTTTKDVSTSVRKGGLYTLSFWAKGDSRLDIKFSGAGSGREFSSAGANPTNLSFDWRYFSLGPVYVGGDAPVENLQITAVGGASPAYLDNIILREIQSYIYVVKNSWATPTSCDSSFTIDSSATDATACTTSGGSWSTDRNECVLSARLPQAQLGCASYYDRTNRLHYLKSFSRLCPVEVAGCEKLIKTNNNDAVAEETFNTENDVNNPATPAADETQGLSAEERFSDNVTIPDDSFTYIVVNDANKCAAQNAGCAEFGSPTLDATGNVKLDDSGKPMYDTVNLLADPTLYNSATGRILCQVGFLSCEEYATTDGGKLYFKDPEPRLCEWKDNVLVSGQSVSGWFKKGIDPAEPCDPANFNGGYYNIWKNGDVKCTLPNVCNNVCTLTSACTADGGCDCPTVGRVACKVDKGKSTCGYGCTCGPVPALADQEPGRTATGTPGTTCTVSYGKRTCPYSDWVGECIPQADKCTKFVDPADTSQNPTGEPYYYINNSKITGGNCNGMVSQKEGCVLFNDTSNPQLDKNANATYAVSEAKSGDPGGLVAPVDNTKQDFKLCVNSSIIAGGTSLNNHEIPGIVCNTVADCPGAPPARAGAAGWRCAYTYSSGGQMKVDVTCAAGVPCTVTYRGQTQTFTPTVSGSQPITIQPNDSNRLVQVRRDRVCGEWLTCSGTNSTFDSQTGRQKILCDTVSSCRQYAKTGQATASCTDSAFTSETSRKILSKDLYVSRNITFKGMDYSGDSIYNQYQAPDLRGINIGTSENSKLALVFVEDRCFNADGTAKTSCGADSPGYCDSDINGSPCSDYGKCYSHICVTNFRGDPFVPGVVLTLDETNAEAASCRAYPEQSSPFPDTVTIAVRDSGENVVSKKPGFAGANVCEKQKICVGGAHPGAICTDATVSTDCGAKACARGTAIGRSCTTDGDCPGDVSAGRCARGTCSGSNSNACECFYKKVSYSGGAVVKYFSDKTKSIPSVCVGGTTPGKICTEATEATDCGGNKTCAGGTNAGKSCTSNTGCPDGTCKGDGQCTPSQREDTVLGWQGYCLERDTANSVNGDPDQLACLTWYPIDQIPGAPDIYNNYPEAGFSKQNVHLCVAADLYVDKKKHPDPGYYCATLGFAELDYCGSYLEETLEDCLKPAIDAIETPWVDATWGEAPTIACSMDEWIVMGNCGGSLNPYFCDAASFDNDCPYHCVPQNSWHETTGLPCRQAEIGGTPGLYKGYSYVILSYDSYSSGKLDDCVKEGVPVFSNITDSSGNRISNLSSGSSPPYYGCKEIVKVSQELGDPDSNKAWTNRAWEAPEPAVPYRIKFDSATDPVRIYLAYVYNILPKPFGNTLNIPGDNLFSIPTCRNATSGAIKLPFLDLLNSRDEGLACESDLTLDPETLPPGATTGVAVPREARPYSLDIVGSGLRPGTPCATTADCNANITCAAVVCSKPCATNADCAAVPVEAGSSQCIDGICTGSDQPADFADWGHIYEPFSTYHGGYTVHCAASGWTTMRGRCVQNRSRIMSPTQYCTSDDFCRTMMVCTGGSCYATGAVTVGGVLTEADPISKAKQRILQIFAKIYTKGVAWDPAAPTSGSFVGKYGGTLLTSEWDITPKDGTAPGGEGWPPLPSIWAITDCRGDKCRPGTPDTVTVGGVSGFGFTPTGVTEPENAVGYGGQYVATMQFFGTADKNTGPLTAVQVDWGDASRPFAGSTNARYKNHLGLGACNDSDFAHSTNACTEDYFQFTHTYTCPINGAGKTPCSGAADDTNCFARNSCPEDVNGGVDGTGSCCVFKPKVQLKDNWGWCNGTCPGPPGPTSNGCYDARSAGGVDECAAEEPGKDPWTYFMGEVIVVPK